MKTLITENIGYLIKENRLKLSEFGAILGVSDAVASTYKKGRAKPSLESILIISEKFNVSCDDLLKKDLSKLENRESTYTGMFGVIPDNIVLEVPIDHKKEPVLKVDYKEKYLEVLEENRMIQNERVEFFKKLLK